MEYWVIYNAETGAELMRGAAQESGAAERQLLDEGSAVMVLPEDVWRHTPLNLDQVKAAISARIDDAAEACRARFITPGAGQAMTYLRKEFEARMVVSGDASNCPFLTAEAAAIGTTVPALAAIVVAAANAWAATGAAIEAARRKAKLDVEGANNLAAIAAAAAVDWSAIS